MYRKKPIIDYLTDRVVLLNRLYDLDPDKLKSDITQQKEALDKGEKHSMYISRTGIELAEKVINLRQQRCSAAETVFRIGQELREKGVSPQNP